MGDTSERYEARRGQRGLFDSRVRILLEVAEQPPGRDPRMPTRVFPRDEDRQLERVDQDELRQILRRRKRHEHVAALERPLEDRVRMALRGRRSSSLGAAAAHDLIDRRSDGPRLDSMEQWAVYSTVCTAVC